ncbi:uncharacterized protein TNCV_1384741 [Trichonephila clavipes]|nr:uncharacterized protein TNCV_1384741 [Trichonephila clavipes]
MFKTAGMHLHKWCGNLPEITSNLQDYAFLESDETKALGVIWNPKLDCFLFRIEQQRLTSFSKRMVFSTIARIFDPLGLLGPIITWANIFMQRLWLLELGWSDELPFKEEKEWRRFIDSLEAVNNICFDRCIVIHTDRRALSYISVSQTFNTGDPIFNLFFLSPHLLYNNNVFTAIKMEFDAKATLRSQLKTVSVLNFVYFSFK